MGDLRPLSGKPYRSSPSPHALVCSVHTCWDCSLAAVLQEAWTFLLPLHILVSDTQHSRGVLGIARPVVSVSKRQVSGEMCSGRMACGGSW